MKESLLLRSIDFLISKERYNNFSKYYDFGNYKFQYNDLEATSETVNDRTIIIFGTIVNSHDYNYSKNDIMNHLLDSKDFFDLINISKKMAGRFVIVYSSKEGLFVLPDAVSSIQVAYDIVGQDLIISSNPKIIADINNYEESMVSKQIKSSAAETHPLPYDMTMYDEVKFVIPNHYLNCENRKVYRYYPINEVKKMTVDEVAKKSAELLENIISGYISNNRLSIALTSGLDSRTILSVCKNYINEIPTYTYFHDNFTDKTDDIVVPTKMSRRFGFKHSILKDLQLPEMLINQYVNKIGSNLNKFEVRNAWTYYNSELYGYKRLDGNVSPLAKSNFGRNLPEFLATPFYLVTKTHNYSGENYREVKRWIKDVYKYSRKNKISKYDLFFWEHRVGKWTSNSYSNSDLLIESLNPFNCRELIEIWLSVPKNKRVNGQIHKKIIKFNWPELLDFPLNPDSRHDIFYKNSLIFYIGSIIKFILGENKY